MRKLGYSISAIATILTTVAGLDGLKTVAAPSPAPAATPLSPTRSFSDPQTAPWLAQNSSSDCRKIGQNYTQFFTNFPGSGGNIGGVGVLNSGQRIRLLDGGQTYPYNGQLYYRISSPFASQNPTVGFISVNTPLSYCGRPALW